MSGILRNTAVKAIQSGQASLTAPIGAVNASVQKLGTTATSIYNSGLTSLSSGAVGFDLNSASGSIKQLSGLAGSATGTVNAISSAVNSDIGALVNTASKYGTAVTATWAQGTAAISNLGSNVTGAVDNISTSGLTNLGQSISSGLTNLNVNSLNLGSLTNSLGPLKGSLGALGASLTSGMDILAKASQFSVNFADFSLSSLVSSVQPAAAFSDTVDRNTIDAAVTRVIGASKVTSPIYGLPSATSLGITADITQAQSILAQAGAVGTALSNQVVNVVNKGKNIGSSIASGLFG